MPSEFQREAASAFRCRLQSAVFKGRGARREVTCSLQAATARPRTAPRPALLSPRFTPTDLTCFDVRCPPTTMQNLCPLTTALGRWEISIFVPFVSNGIRVCLQALIFKVVSYLSITLFFIMLRIEFLSFRDFRYTM